MLKEKKAKHKNNGGHGYLCIHVRNGIFISSYARFPFGLKKQLFR